MQCYLRILLLLTGLFCSASLYAQDEDTTTLTQKIRGQVTDAESKLPLADVTVYLVSNNQINTFTDSDGYYTLDSVPVGRQSVSFRFTGYELKTINEVLVSSGKELELNASLTESINTLKEVSVTGHRGTQAQNEFASLSSRSFSPDETRRYAASISDPARMVMNFAGVAGNGDLENDIVVRGNSPKGVLWRLEGIEIPNPNHFNFLGNSGGAVSMLNANTLASSDFYTGAFPPEIGDALSGAFDLYMRNGNKDNYEHTVQIGVLGTEVATEGPFKKGGQASYLIDYRYNTLALLLNYLNLNGLIPDYQDLSFKLNFSTKKAGTFSVFGLGGINKYYTDPAKDSTQWTDEDPNAKLLKRGKMGVAGITHQYFLDSRSYIKTVVSASYELSLDQSDTLAPVLNYASVPYTNAQFVNSAIRASIFYNNKIDARNTIRTGIIAQQLNYSLERDNFYNQTAQDWEEILKKSGGTQFYEAYLQWKNRLSNRFTMISGVHGAYFALNQKYAVEPRASISYTAKASKISLSSGLYSRPENISTYLYTDPQVPAFDTFSNRNLDLLRAFHIVLGYERSLPLKSRIKIEAYYQYLYNIPVERSLNSGFSILNTESVYDLINTQPLVSTGTGTNYGIDLTLERPLADNYYVLLTASLFKSTYTNYAGNSFEGHYDRTYMINFIGGKDFYLNKKARSILGINGKVVYSGGQRESPIDVGQSIAYDKPVYVYNQYFTLKDPYYFRMDASVYYKHNNKKATHTIEFDVQNATNRRNFSYTYFDTRSNSVKNVKETGLIPILSYRVEFHNY